MIIEEVVTNIRDLHPETVEKLHQEKVYMESENLMKRIQRVETDHGRDIGIRLRNPRDLEDGDVLYMDDENIVLIDVMSDNLIIIMPQDMNEMGTIAHQLGNRHLPAQFEGDEMLIQYDYLVEELLEEMGIPFKLEERKVKKAFRHIGHSHD